MNNLYSDLLTHKEQKDEVLKEIEKESQPKVKKKCNLLISLDHLEDPQSYRNNVTIFAKQQNKTIKEYVLELIDKDMKSKSTFSKI